MPKMFFQVLRVSYYKAEYWMPVRIGILNAFQQYLSHIGTKEG